MTEKLILLDAPACAACTKVQEYPKRPEQLFNKIDVRQKFVVQNDMVCKPDQHAALQDWVINVTNVGFDHTRIDRLLSSNT